MLNIVAAFKIKDNIKDQTKGKNKTIDNVLSGIFQKLRLRYDD